MATKRTTQQQQKAALRLRIADIMTAASGSDADEEEFFLTIADLPRVLNALNIRFPDMREKDHLMKTWNLDQYETVDLAVDFLWRNGIRA